MLNQEMAALMRHSASTLDQEWMVVRFSMHLRLSTRLRLSTQVHATRDHSPSMLVLMCSMLDQAVTHSSARRRQGLLVSMTPR